MILVMVFVYTHVCVCGWLYSCTLYSSNMLLLTSAPLQTTKLRSFQRQLNLWGFKRISKNGPDKDVYYHEHFIRGQPEYMDKMVRIKIKGNATSSTPPPPRSPPLCSSPAMAYGGDGDDQHDDVGVESKRGPSPSRSKIRMSKRQSYDLHCSMMRLSPNVTTGQQRPPMAMVHRRRSDPTPYVMPNTLAYQPNHDNRSALYYPPTANGISASYQLSTELKSHLDVEEEDEFDRYIDNNIHFIG